MIGEKFKAIRKEKGLTLSEVVKALGLKSNGHLSQIERGEKEPSDALIHNFKSTFSISENWWQAGTPPMFTEEKERAGPETKKVELLPENRELLDLINQLDNSGKKQVRIEVLKMLLAQEQSALTSEQDTPKQ